MLLILYTVGCEESCGLKSTRGGCCLPVAANELSAKCTFSSSLQEFVCGVSCSISLVFRSMCCLLSEGVRLTVLIIVCPHLLGDAACAARLPYRRVRVSQHMNTILEVASLMIEADALTLPEKFATSYTALQRINLKPNPLEASALVEVSV